MQAYTVKAKCYGRPFTVCFEGYIALQTCEPLSRVQTPALHHEATFVTTYGRCNGFLGATILLEIVVASSLFVLVRGLVLVKALILQVAHSLTLVLPSAMQEADIFSAHG